MHEYYTSKTTKKQAYLAIFTIFVNYADFYVNIIMSTAATIPRMNFAKNDSFAIYSAGICDENTKY